MPAENLDETEIDDEDDNHGDISTSDNTSGDDGYSINVDEALSKDIKGSKPPDPAKVDKAQRLGFDLGLDPSTIPPKPQATV